MEMVEVLFEESGLSWILNFPEFNATDTAELNGQVRTILDATRESLVVNWTVHGMSPAVFLKLLEDLADELPDNRGALGCVVQCGSEPVEDTTYGALIKQLGKAEPLPEYNLVRVDLDSSSSIAWEALPGLGGIVLGFGVPWATVTKLISREQSVFNSLMYRTDYGRFEDVQVMIEKLMVDLSGREFMYQAIDK